MGINKKDIIRLHSNVKITKKSGHWTFSFDSKTLHLPPQVLKVVDVFQEWISIEEGFKKINNIFNDKKDSLSTFSTFHKLLKEGFFETQNKRKQTFGFHSGKFDSFPVHLRMLNDSTRTFAFQKAIRDTVTKDDIVLDIGTGNGILAATAALCGAKKVYAVERTEFIEVARAVFKANGLEDKITLIKGDSTKIELPEKATVLVSEIIGNDAFDEGILSTYSDAKKRLLTANAKLIPSNIQVFVIPMEFEQKHRASKILNNQAIQNWKNNYGINFSPFLDFNEEKEVQTKINNIEIKKQKKLSSSIKVAEVNFYDDDYSVENLECTFSIQEEGILNGYLIYFETELSESNFLSLNPEKLSEHNHWALLSFCLPWEKAVQKGDTFKLNYELKQLKSVVKITAE